MDVSDPCNTDCTFMHLSCFKVTALTFGPPFYFVQLSVFQIMGDDPMKSLVSEPCLGLI
jgi:hypothetical protein